MAGSRKAFTYRTDNNTSQGILLDESKGEATIGNGLVLVPPYVDGTPRLSCGLRPRYVNCVSTTDPLIRRRFIVGDPGTYTAITGGALINEAASGGLPAQSYRVTSKRGERENLLSSVDTGQTDGDNP